MASTAAFTSIAPFYDELMKDVPYGVWARYIRGTAHRLSFEPETVLDLACGTGSLTLILARQGYKMIGIDGSEAMIAEARRKAAEAGLDLPFHQGDLRNFRLDDSVDMVVCLYDSLNNLLDPADILAAFQRVAAALHPGGLFIFDVNTEFALRANLFSQRNLSPDARVQYLWESRYDYGMKLCTVEMQFWVQDDQGERAHYTEVHRQRAYNPAQLQRMLAQAGLDTLGMYDGLSLRPPESRTDRMYCVARLPDQRS